MMTVSFVILALVALFLAWYWICLELAHKQRRALIYYLFRQSDWHSLMIEFNKVSYDGHIWALFLLRNPQNLYHPDLQPAFSV